MTIEYGAFANCCSLKEIVFKSIEEPVFTNISKNDKLPKDFKIVVPDDIYDKEVEIELPYSKSHVSSFSREKVTKFKEDVKNADVYFAVAELEKISEHIQFIADVIQYLICKYGIDNSNYELAKSICKFA